VVHTGTGNLLVTFVAFTGSRTCAVEKQNAKQQKGEDQFYFIPVLLQEYIHYYFLFSL